MRRSHLPLLLTLAMMVGASAFGEQPSEADASKMDADRLSEHFRDFVDEALDEGLLLPTEANQAAPDQLFRGRLQQAEDSGPSLTKAGCPMASVYDFHDFVDFTTYEDFLLWRQQRLAGNGVLPPVNLAKAYIATGLYAEARLELSRVEDEESRFLMALSRLLEDAEVPDIDIFEAATECGNTNSLWLAAAQLSLLNPAGADLLDRQLVTFRRLPHQIKIQLASNLIPLLDRMKHKLLAEKLLADFEPSVIQRSRGLSFGKALLDRDEAAIRQYLVYPEVRSQAAAALVRFGFPVDPSLQGELVDNALQDVQRLPENANVRASIQTMLNDLDDTSDYALLTQLAKLSTLRAPEMRDLLSEQFEARLRKDLLDTEGPANLAAISALAENRALLEERPESGDIFTAASEQAANLGLKSLADLFGGGAQASSGQVSEQAALAYRMADFETLRVLSREVPENPDVARLASMSAIMTQDKAWLQQAGAHVPLDVGTLVALIECDAAAGKWMLPSSIYSTVERIDDQEYRDRIESILGMRARAMGANSRTIELAAIPDELALIEASLNSNAWEMP
ncbi:hypothetical protein [Hyphomonas pacifica]|uniref:hypothetical protein n=1 Tax=Hyphomonas pacifica TaxID=1280941 RepID=UPI000DBF9721|nr:hypothetical protein [Hyphomonas pacifica]RAN37516.1 hypothetical protein HY11_08500 [Hyphomonas pacifica]